LIIIRTSKKAEIPATWFGILTPCLSSLAPFSKWWESKYKPSATVKNGIGMTLGIGFVFYLWFKYNSVGAKVSVSLIISDLHIFFPYNGRIVSSPVGLSYVSKLVPGRMIAFMFGVWYLAIAISGTKNC
jgi:POT family proton-dependent oligopeptide transporter